MNIDFITFIGPNSGAYAEYLKYTCEISSSKKHNIKWKCVESVGADKLPNGYKCVAKAKDYEHNSLSHGMAMNLALNYIDSEYVVFIDADMAVVYKNWDDVIVNELNEYDCFGVSYDEKVKYRNFPTVYLIAFRSYILEKVTLDFTPKIIQGVEKPVRYVINEHEAKLFDMPVGSQIKCDTGWQLPLLIKGAGFKAKSLSMVNMTSKKSQLPFENKQHKSLCMQKSNHQSEWHYNEKLFTTHKQASRTQPLDGVWGQAWKRRIDLYMRRNNGVYI